MLSTTWSRAARCLECPFDVSRCRFLVLPECSQFGVSVHGLAKAIHRPHDKLTFPPTLQTVVRDLAVASARIRCPSLATLAALTRPICRTFTRPSDTSPLVAPTRRSRSCRLRGGWQLSGNESSETTTKSSNTTEVGRPLLYSIRTLSSRKNQTNRQAFRLQGVAKPYYSKCLHPSTRELRLASHKPRASLDFLPVEVERKRCLRVSSTTSTTYFLMIPDREMKLTISVFRSCPRRIVPLWEQIGPHHEPWRWHD